MANRTLLGQLSEACLAPADSLDGWCAAICRAAEPIFERGHARGAMMTILRTHPPYQTKPDFLAWAGTDSLAEVAEKGKDHPYDRTDEYAPAFRPFRISLLSRLYRRRTLRGHPAWDRFRWRDQFSDQLGITLGAGCFGYLWTMMASREWARERTRDLQTVRRLVLRSLAARVHVHGPEHADAVIAPDGKIMCAADGLGNDTRAMLTNAVHLLERARTDARVTDEASRLWGELLQGRWSVIEHVESDGKRLLLLARNAQTDAGLDAAASELLRRIDDGMSIKAIAAELGVSATTASERISAVLAKLGFASRDEYTRFRSPKTH